jgi:hypothetical protein
VISFGLTGSGEGKFTCLSTPEQAEAAIKMVRYDPKPTAEANPSLHVRAIPKLDE